MLRHAREKTPNKDQTPSKNVPLSSRVMEGDDSEDLHVFKGPDGDFKPNFDSKELKKITVKIIRKAPQSTVPVLQRAITNPSTVAPVRRSVIFAVSNHFCFFFLNRYRRNIHLKTYFISIRSSEETRHL